MPAGVEFFTALGINLVQLPQGRRPLARVRRGWSERRHHRAGALGAALFEPLVGTGWLVSEPAGRAARVTETGTTYLQEVFADKEA
ncbi:MAG: transcriptional regulator, partial [Actinomycetes bacterium]